VKEANAMTKLSHSAALAALTLASCGLASFGLLSCGKEEAGKVSLPPAAVAPVAAAPIRVETILASAQEVAAPVFATGTSQPIRKADLAPAMSARIEKIYVREGQRVKAGQILLTLDGKSAQLGAEQARAQAAASAAQADQLDADYQRLAPLAERGSVAASRLEQLDSQRKAARAQSRAAQSAAGAAGKVAQNAILRAPFPGTIVDLPHEVGEMAAGNGSLARLVDLSRLEIHVRVAARDLGRLSVSDSVRAAFPQLGVTAAGTIATIGLEVDPATSTAEVVAVIPNPDGSLRGGLFTELELAPAQKRRALIVPKTAVAGAGATASVFAVEGGKAARRAVAVVPFDASRVEITKGLPDGTAIVAGQLDRVRDGAQVSAAPRPDVTSAAQAVEETP
jgi:membrane fusion protein, multidrug efflux system